MQQQLSACSQTPKRFVPALLVCLIGTIIFGLLYTGLTPWQRHLTHFGKVSANGIRNSLAPIIQQLATDSKNSPNVTKKTLDQLQTSLNPVAAPVARSLQVPLDVKALRINFPRMKEATQTYSKRYSAKFNQMMISHLPVVNTNEWKPHSPSGKAFTMEQVKDVALTTREPGFLVPNVAHFVLPFGETNMQFHHMVSILSCLHVMKPHRLLLWYAPGKLPKGQWWDRLRKNLTESEWDKRIIMMQRPIPTSVYTVPVHNKEHQSDVMRMEAVLLIGGVYMDIDVFVLKPLEPLRKFPCTIGREVPYALCNGVFMSAPNGTFLAMWHMAYQVFNDNFWGDHSLFLPNKMHPIFPDLCHVEEQSMDRPNWTDKELKWIYGTGQQSHWDWRKKNYVMHLWFRFYAKHHNMHSIKTLNNMYGQMCRYILFGTL